MPLSQCLSFLCVSSEEPENVEKFQKRLVKVTPQHNDECKKLLQLMGIPFIEVCLFSLSLATYLQTRQLLKKKQLTSMFQLHQTASSFR